MLHPLVVFAEHIGDITTNSAVVGKDFFQNPGNSRTMLGDGLATIAAGLIGGPANTTYGEKIQGHWRLQRKFMTLPFLELQLVMLSYLGLNSGYVRQFLLRFMGGFYYSVWNDFSSRGRQL